MLRFHPPAIAGGTDRFQVRLNKNYRLRTGNLKTAATTHVPASQHVVNPHQVVAGLVKTCFVLFVSSAWWLRLLRPFQPAHVIFGAFATVRTAIRRLLYLFLLVKKIT